MTKTVLLVTLTQPDGTTQLFRLPIVAKTIPNTNLVGLTYETVKALWDTFSEAMEIDKRCFHKYVFVAVDYTDQNKLVFRRCVLPCTEKEFLPYAIETEEFVTFIPQKQSTLD